MITSADLQRFCSKEEWRHFLQKPFSRNQFTFATNGHILVRVPRLDDVPEVPEAPDVEKILPKNFHEVKIRPMVSGTLPKVQIKVEQCDVCDGIGHEHKCPDCSCDCESCEGTGEIRISSDDKASVSIGDAVFSLSYIRELQLLPDVHVPENPHKTNPMPFKFNGGIGIIAPMSRKQRNHLDIKV